MQTVNSTMDPAAVPLSHSAADIFETYLTQLLHAQERADYRAEYQ